MDPIPVSSFPSPPESQAGSPAEMNSIEKILLQLQPFLTGKSGEHEFEVDGVTPALLAELNLYMTKNTQRDWEKLR